MSNTLYIWPHSDNWCCLCSANENEREDKTKLGAIKLPIQLKKIVMHSRQFPDQKTEEEDQHFSRSLERARLMGAQAR